MALTATTQRICGHSLVLRVHEGPAALGDPWQGGWACMVEDLGNSTCIIHAAPNVPGDNETEKMANARIVFRRLALDSFTLALWRRIKDGRDYWHHQPLARFNEDIMTAKSVTVGVGHHDCTFAYPTVEDFKPAVRNVIARLRGDTTIDAACFTHCSWVCAGYAASHVPHDHPPTHTTQAHNDPIDRDEVITVLEGAEQAASTSMRGINWLRVWEVVRFLIIQGAELLK